MIKKIALSSFASVLLLSQVANAEIKLGDKGSLGTIAFNAGYNTSYVWRGIDQNSGSGSPYIGADLNTPLGIYLGTWTSGASGTGYSQEVDIYAGIKKSIGPVTIDLGVIEYRYPGANQKANANNFTEGYVKLTIAPDKAPFTIGAAYYEDDTKGMKGTNRVTGNNTYQEINATYDFGVVQSFVSLGEYKNNTDVTTITLSKSMFDLGFALSYVDSDTKSRNAANAIAPIKDKEFAILTVSKTF
jgi:uncharacterized protein (TIGR02001 family)